MKTLAYILTAAALVLASCAGPSKKESSQDILVEDLDTTVSPRADFFEYASGGWLNANPIPPNERARGIAYLVRDETYARVKTV